jgi:ribosomal protein S18 acetylase RimI-like enzyme
LASDPAASANRPIIAAAPTDRLKVALTLAAAFHDDPVFGWFFPDADQRRAHLPELFARLYDVDMRFGSVVRSPGFEATSFWRAPGKAATPSSVFMRHMPALLRLFGTRIGRLMAVSSAIEAHMPKEPFWYAHFVAVRPAAQHQGWGRAMMQGGIARAAADGVPVYLETARIENVVFYQGLGFTVTGEWDVPKGPHFWSLTKAV